MRVSLRKEDETASIWDSGSLIGLFKRPIEYSLYVKVELSDDEKKAIKAAGIEDFVLMAYAYKGVDIDWKVKSVVHISDKRTESRFVARNAIERTEMEETVKEQLAALKSQISAQMAGTTGTESFEL